MLGGGEKGEYGERSPLLLEIERSGAGTGRFLRLRVDQDGLVTLRRPPQAERLSQLDPAQLTALRSHVAGAHFNSLSSAYFMPRAAQPDGSAWRIRHGQRTVSTRDGEAPMGLARLMTVLDGMIDRVESETWSPQTGVS